MKNISLDISGIEFETVLLQHAHDHYEHLKIKCAGEEMLIIFTYNLNIDLFKSILRNLNEVAEVILVFNASTCDIYNDDKIKKTKVFFKELLTLHKKWNLTTYITYFNHAKFVLTKTKIYFSSANLSFNSKNNLEFSIIGKHNNSVEKQVRDLIKYINNYSISIYLDENNALNLQSSLIHEKSYDNIIIEFEKVKKDIDNIYSKIEENEYYLIDRYCSQFEESVEQVRERLVDSLDRFEEMINDMNNYCEIVVENEVTVALNYVSEIQEQIEELEIELIKLKESLFDLIETIEETYKRNWTEFYNKEVTRANSEGIPSMEEIIKIAESQTVYEFTENLNENSLLINLKLIPCLETIKSLVVDALYLAGEIYEYNLEIENTEKDKLLFAWDVTKKFTKHIEILKNLKEIM